MNMNFKDHRSKNIRFSLELAILMMSLSSIVLTWFHIDGSLLFYVVLSASFLYCAYVFIKIPKAFLKTFKYEILFALVCMVGILLNKQDSSPDSYVRLAEIGIFTLALGSYDYRQSKAEVGSSILIIFKIVIGFTFLVVFVSLLFQIVAFIGGPMIPQMEYFKLGMFGGLYGNGNQLAINAYISLMLSIYLWGNERKTFYVVNSVFQGFSILVSGCRSILVIMIVTLAYVAWKQARTHSNGKNSKWLKIGIIVIAIVCVFILIYVSYEKAKMYQSGDSVELILNQITGNRYGIWNEALTVFSKHPVFGVGLNNMRAAAQRILPQSALYNTRGYENAHNMIVNILGYTGIVGLCSAGLLGVKYWKNAKTHIQSNPTDKVLWLLCFGLLLVDQLDIVLVFDSRLATFVFFLILGNWCFMNKKEEET